MRFSLQPPLVALCALSLRNANITLGHSAGSLAVVMGQGCLAAGASSDGVSFLKGQPGPLNNRAGILRVAETDRQTADINTV